MSKVDTEDFEKGGLYKFNGVDFVPVPPRDEDVEKLFVSKELKDFVMEMRKQIHSELKELAKRKAESTEGGSAAQKVEVRKPDVDAVVSALLKVGGRSDMGELIAEVIKFYQVYQL